MIQFFFTQFYLVSKLYFKDENMLQKNEYLIFYLKKCFLVHKKEGKTNSEFYKEFFQFSKMSCL